jgi:hypothetical protein
MHQEEKTQRFMMRMSTNHAPKEISLSYSNTMRVISDEKYLNQVPFSHPMNFFYAWRKIEGMP